MLLALTLLPAALAVPKVYSERIALLAVAPDGHHVLLGAIGAFDERPARIVERDVATGVARPVLPEVEAALATCEATAPCPAFDLAWRPGAWIAPPAPAAAWTLLAPGPDGWTLSGGDTTANEGTLFTPCQARAGANTLDLEARPDAIRLTLTGEGQPRTVSLSRERLARLGVEGDPWGSLVVWGSDGVLVAWPGAWADEGEAVEPLLVFVLPTR